MARRLVNGFPVYEEGEECEGCGAVQHKGEEDDVAGYYLECPTCGEPGCEECMPMGRGVECPSCEETGGDEDLDDFEDDDEVDEDDLDEDTKED